MVLRDAAFATSAFALSVRDRRSVAPRTFASCGITGVLRGEALARAYAGMMCSCSLTHDTFGMWCWKRWLRSSSGGDADGGPVRWFGTGAQDSLWMTQTFRRLLLASWAIQLCVKGCGEREEYALAASWMQFSKESTRHMNQRCGGFADSRSLRPERRFETLCWRRKVRPAC